MAFFKHFLQKRAAASRIYLDYASSTPLDETLLRHVPHIPREIAGANPSALHQEGVALKRYLSEARARVAAALGAHADEIVFTSNATESDNLAVHGTVRGLLNVYAPHEIAVMASAIEHSAIGELLAQQGSLASLGVQCSVIPAPDGYVDENMIIVPADDRGEPVKALVISVMFGNNEIGTMQPIAAIAKRVRFLRKQHPGTQIFFHTDATQVPLFVSLNVAKLGVDMLTLGATKLYCHKGAGLLYVRRGVPIAPIVYGGGQERGLRPGTEPVALIHEFSYALQCAQQHVDAESARVTALRDYFEMRVSELLPQAIVTAKDAGEGRGRVPHISHVAIHGIESELLVIELDARGIAVSAKSACKNEEEQESSLVTMLYGTKQGQSASEQYGAVRFSFGRTTTKRDVEKAAKALAAVVGKYKK